ncbi:amino acid ABC transporter substrate-binding protein [Agrobacterium rosae]|uniref:Amino acid ABC transporter substrate-binding protein n=1 Tax=Agrobacterium rosae TaxID=1972867 RepID=A0ABU4VTW8_9HYPH|nr:amino acid ABC transporter substrate-binding protein [Agrobacterium rosae]KAA3515517.1 amino acid ABC transporter substrate-binding protein [Agrobacterium rosae]KAA3524482.1 amino acid ABC transporter substrate-binding protein [Agrobacterium rosae]MBN7804212.1 amino acid ABC transporter substrate-binding protein [Agrobacterium rosae]MCM2431395.1 amino acid ABC transporter substrate-binding protein [Agrobacterium rosae]MDX8328939.1 amino acid ABC transporter substrate-binding protein [Agroba
MRYPQFWCVNKKLLKFALSSAILFQISGGAASLAHAQESGTLDKIARTKTISIGYREDEVPFAYKTADGSAIGYTVELCNDIAEHIRAQLNLDKININYVIATPATRFLLVKSGKIDLECSATTNNAERREQVAFSYPHFITATRFVAKKSSQVKSIRDLAGRTVASTTGTVNVDQLQNINRADNLNISVMLARQNSDGFAFVETNKATAFVMDGVLLAAHVAFSKSPDDYMISSETFGPPEPYGILMRKGDDAFNKVVNDALRQLFVSGEINRIYDKWFMSPIPPEGRNFNLPMSSELQAAFHDPKEYLQ